MSTKVRDAGNCFIVGMAAGAVLADGRGIRIALGCAIALGIVNLALFLRSAK